ncbi:polysaccharide biosynthesis protein [Riemerella anatipestifer]|uniref:polysaccharide biosynthesis protein n=1 Tax=Riemerella anatipestifer TaxID=34085 RepID=UPI0013725C1B|nr:polysaccharide biosynthesis protein [Riemerella anatipestifer]MBT0550287.1 polysaccharide biosynthesis protein [Riemerella anatipestifer]MBT0556001.1 polysaccharide biosynthesis protein [Riemerella anatipestifer]MBT0561047.1 polysaccharide biosynthesis protein [Riemerella anatipestifer]MCU7570991.1 polysaccharide biosynthesis protein [Riemerella anatipestifer]NAV16454.1 NAD-dependent epimerase/dehydratase family protein [Riemerella anatipestifer]
MFKDKVLLITGGTGSFGNAMLKGFLNSDLKEIRIFSRDEKKQEDMRVEYKNDKLNFVIGDIRDFDSINSAMKGVDFVFHAAALKQVPSCEFYPLQAVKTNVLGSENVLEAAARNSVQRIVVLSTDKAVYPINAMGMSKAMMEKLTISKARDPRVSEVSSIYTCTRYGNVMCSRGSIIPLFISQIKKGKALTITNPDMTRFMMSLDDSVDLVMYAFKNGEPGDIFVQKSPATKISILAQALKEIFNADNEIKIIGERHSEKMYETLCSKEEMAKAIDLGDFYKIPADYRDLNYTKYVQKDGPKLKSEEYNSENTKQLNIEETKELLLKLDYVKNQLVK